MALDVLDAAAARRWAVGSLAALAHAREEIDALNVFPVPDGDTGTNLFLTLEAACAAVAAQPPDADVRQVSDAFARGALLGARGNSGVIVAQLLRGWADVLAERGRLDAEAAREAFARSDRQAWAAVAEPVEGTILSVSRAAAEAARASGGALADVVAAGVSAAREALARTPSQLEVLRRAGVVDAGGRGAVVLFEALDDVVHGRGLRPRASRQLRAPALPPVDLAACGDLALGGPAYEVMYLLDGPDTGIPQLRRQLAPLGDSLVVVGGSGLWHVHVHVDDPGAAIEAGIAAGRPHQVRITHFADQTAAGGVRPAVGALAAGAAVPGQPAVRRPRVPVGLVAGAAGPGLAEAFASAGAIPVLGGPGRRPSTAELLAAIRQVNADAVVVLPNDPDTQAVAEAAAVVARQDGLRVSVLPTRAQVQGLAAAAVHDPVRGFDDDLVRMSAAAGATRDGAVTVAVRDAITMAGPCRAGDALGVVQGDFAVVGDDLATVAIEVTERLLSGGGELLTVVTGADSGDALVKAVTRHVARSRREVEISVLDGGQPRYPLLLGVE